MFDGAGASPTVVVGRCCVFLVSSGKSSSLGGFERLLLGNLCPDDESGIGGCSGGAGAGRRRAQKPGVCRCKCAVAARRADSSAL